MSFITEIVSYQDAGKLLNLSYWQLKTRVSNGSLEAVKLPSGHSALTTASVRKYKEQVKK